MPLIERKTYYCRIARFASFLTLSLLVSLFAIAQINLRFRMLNGYFLSNDATVNKGRPTLFVFEQPETMDAVFKPATTMNQRPDHPNFTREMVVGIAVPPTTTPLKLSVSKVFVQDSTLTVRYIRMTDTTQTKAPQSFTSQPMLLMAIPKQTVLRTRLVENGKVIQTIRKRESD